MTTNPTGQIAATDGRSEIPACKGCGSRNLVATAQATTHCSYYIPTRVENGELHFAYSTAGYGENETWKIACGDCGRRMRTKLVPVNDD